MSGSITDSDAGGNDWDDTWTPQQGAAYQISNFVWKPLWRKFQIKVHFLDGTTTDHVSACLVPCKMQFFIQHHLQRLQKVIKAIKSIDVESINSSNELLEIKIKSQSQDDIFHQIETAISNESEDIIMKTVLKHPFTEKLLEEICFQQLRETNIDLLSDDTKVCIVGFSEMKEFIYKAVTEIDRATVKRVIKWKDKWKMTAALKFRLIETISTTFGNDLIIGNQEEKCSFYIHGREEAVEKALKELDRLLSALFVEKIEVNVHLLQLLAFPEASVVFTDILESKHLPVVWVIDEEQISFVSQSELDRSIIRSEIYANFHEIGFVDSVQNQRDFVTSKAFVDFTNVYINKLLLTLKTSTGITVVSTKAIIHELLHLEKLVYINQSNTKETQVTIVDDKYIKLENEYISLENNIKDVESNWKKETTARINAEKALQQSEENIKRDHQCYTESEAKYKGEQSDLKQQIKQLTYKVNHEIEEMKKKECEILQLKERLTKMEHDAQEYMGYQMMPYSCQNCQNADRKTLGRGMLPETLQSNSFISVEIMSPEGTPIDDEKLQEIVQYISSISSDIFYYRTKEQNMLILIGSQSEKLQTATTKTEFILGLQKHHKCGRKDGNLATEANYQSGQDEAKNIKTFQQSIMTSKTSFSQSYSGHSTSPTQLIPSEVILRTAEGLTIYVYVGNILNLNVDCIVNAANETLSHDRGVAEAISRAAGYGFQDESDDYIKRNGPLKVSECCTTSAGNLKYKCVIHAVSPRWYDYPADKKALCANDLQNTIFNSIKEAENQKCASVAIPAICSAIFGVPKDVCCPQYRKAVQEYITICRMTSLKEIHFVDNDRDMISKIQVEFSMHLNIAKSVQSVANADMSSISAVSGDLPRLESGSQIESGHLMKSLSSNPDLNKDKQQLIHTRTYDATFKESAQFQKQFIAKKGFKVCIVQGDITKMNVDRIVCPQDDLCLNRGMIAKIIEYVSDESYTNAIMQMKIINRCEVRKIAASPSSLPFKAVLHTVAPRWDKNAVKDKQFVKELGLTIRNIIRHCSDSIGVNTVAIPLLGLVSGADGHDTLYATYASILAREILNELKSDKFKLQEIDIVTHEYGIALSIADQFNKEAGFKALTSFQRQQRCQNKDETDNKDNTKNTASTSGEMTLGTEHGESKHGTTVKGENVDNCGICMDALTDPRKLKCGHIFCHKCIKHHFKINNNVCPTCGSIHGVLTGNQPPGKMKITRRHIPLAGYPDYARIEITYDIYSGKQGHEHKTPGCRFEGIKIVGYLPDNAKGQLVAKMLKVAFERKLVFTIGDSRTTGKQGVITWNGIHHKTNPKPHSEFGYPDASYLDKVIDELSVKGITEKDVKHIRL